MQLQDLVTPIDQQSDEELMERLRTLRHSRTVIRPAAARHKKKAVKKVSNAKISKVSAITETMSQEDILAMIALLENS